MHAPELNINHLYWPKNNPDKKCANVLEAVTLWGIMLMVLRELNRTGFTEPRTADGEDACSPRCQLGVRRPRSTQRLVLVRLQLLWGNRCLPFGLWCRGQAMVLDRRWSPTHVLSRGPGDLPSRRPSTPWPSFSFNFGKVYLVKDPVNNHYDRPHGLFLQMPCAIFAKRGCWRMLNHPPYTRFGGIRWNESLSFPRGLSFYGLQECTTTIRKRRYHGGLSSCFGGCFCRCLCQQLTIIIEKTQEIG